jgi:hypothetical protein
MVLALSKAWCNMEILLPLQVMKCKLKARVMLLPACAVPMSLPHGGSGPAAGAGGFQNGGYAEAFPMPAACLPGSIFYPDAVELSDTGT